MVPWILFCLHTTLDKIQSTNLGHPDLQNTGILLQLGRIFVVWWVRLFLWTTAVRKEEKIFIVQQISWIIIHQSFATHYWGSYFCICCSRHNTAWRASQWKKIFLQADLNMYRWCKPIAKQSSGHSNSYRPKNFHSSNPYWYD